MKLPQHYNVIKYDDIHTNVTWSCKKYVARFWIVQSGHYIRRFFVFIQTVYLNIQIEPLTHHLVFNFSLITTKNRVFEMRKFQSKYNLLLQIVVESQLYNTSELFRPYEVDKFGCMLESFACVITGLGFSPFNKFSL